MKYKCKQCNDTHYILTPKRGQYVYVLCDCSPKIKRPIPVVGVCAKPDTPNDGMKIKFLAGLITAGVASIPFLLGYLMLIGYGWAVIALLISPPIYFIYWVTKDALQNKQTTGSGPG